MLEVFLQLVDRFIQLISVRNKRRKTVFGDIFKPMFGEIEKIHSDYLSTFSSCLRTVDEEDAIAKIILAIEEKRRPLLPARQKVQALVKAYPPTRSHVPGEEDSYEIVETAFIQAVADYFGLSHTWGTMGTETQDLMRSLEAKSVDTGYGVTVPIDNEADVEEYEKLDRKERTLISYGVINYIASRTHTDEQEKRRIASMILSSQIEILGARWGAICYQYAALQFAVARLSV